MKRIVGWLFMLCLVVACSDPDQGPPLGPFAAIAKTETDAPFSIVPPTSKSPAGFSYTSSKPEVATIEGSVVTIRGPGQSTITASQGSVGGWGPTSATTTLTVTAVPCETANSVRINGVCTAVPNCIFPAVLTNNVCVAPPPTNATTVTANSLTWAGVSNSDVWANADAFCVGSTIGGQTGWRMPTRDELIALQQSGLIAGHNWMLGNTWSSDRDTTAGAASHVAVNLATGAVTDRADTAFSYVSCVRQAGGG
jgi:hypothetical protein